MGEAGSLNPPSTPKQVFFLAQANELMEKVRAQYLKYFIANSFLNAQFSITGPVEPGYRRILL